MNTILTVCIGNICRSPVAEGLLKAALPNKTIFSAGLGALVGNPADPVAQKIALETDGIDISNHRAQQLTSYLCKQADLILVMESSHKKEIESLYPFTRGKVFRIGELEKNHEFEIEDPYKKEEVFFRETHKKIATGIKNWIKKINKIK